ncbi:MAG: hypothetical protein CMF61_06430 [Magnetococcales bacterium]|nr:hypothetical protein [Magnetococcales bacterium]PPR16423.1 MAG: hypothetical protein CFH43_00812 [Pseudomonadota bacterium]|tara:strand:- start:39 stop:608 length:570 start_codon:yes stop_codon:yes gene_type:complete
MAIVIFTQAEFQQRQQYGMEYTLCESKVFHQPKTDGLTKVKRFFKGSDDHRIAGFRKKDSIYLVEDMGEEGAGYNKNYRFTRVTPKVSQRIITHTELDGFRAHGIHYQHNPEMQAIQHALNAQFDISTPLTDMVKALKENALKEAVETYPEAEVFAVDDIQTCLLESADSCSVQFRGACTLVPLQEKFN